MRTEFNTSYNFYDFLSFLKCLLLTLLSQHHYKVFLYMDNKELHIQKFCEDCLRSFEVK